jgi:phosphatidylinositol kinase/protein kinase (PI-3  family)
MLWNTPGSLNFETAPFKFTQGTQPSDILAPRSFQLDLNQFPLFVLFCFPFQLEYIDVLGPQDEWLPEFKKMFFDGLVAARRCMDRIVQLTRMSILGVSADKVPCAIGGEQMMLDFEARFGMQMTQEELASHVDYLTTASLSSWSTIHYDRYQYHTRGILW